jgi:hypothetical protein
MRKPRSGSKLKPKSDERYYEFARLFVRGLVEANLEPDECTYILVVSLATILSNYNGTRTVQDVIDRWRQVAEGSENTVRMVASNVIDQFCQMGGYQ